jgi:hypothetical protein
MFNFRQRLKVAWIKRNNRRQPPQGELSMRLIARTWYPLALSWLVMSMEGVVSSAFLARMPHPEINLAAYGGVSFAIAFVLSSPIAMMLAASTTLSRNMQAYLRLRRFMIGLGVTITVIYALVAFSPLYYWIADVLIGAPPEIIEPGRLGLMILLPFPFLVGLRRLPQGVMIRFGQSGGVTACTVIRLVAESILMYLGFMDGRLPGVVVATGAQTVGMILETIYANVRVRKILQNELKRAPVDEELTWKDLIHFYLPLLLTTIISFSFQFITSAGLSRMPLALESLAVFPVSSGLLWLLQSFGVAWNEVVVALVDHPGSLAKLRRFTVLLFGGSFLFMLLFLVTPASMWWFTRVSSLSLPLARMANTSLWWMLLCSGLAAVFCWYQGLILHCRRTRGLSESIVVSLVVEVLVLVVGIVWGRFTGLYVASFAFLLSYSAQIAWLYLRSRPVVKVLLLRDSSNEMNLNSQGRNCLAPHR